jgi:hypothetical protein
MKFNGIDFMTPKDNSLLLSFGVIYVKANLVDSALSQVIRSSNFTIENDYR